MQQRARHHRSGPCVREPTQSCGRRGPSPTSCLSQDGPLACPSLPWPSCGGGRPPSQLQRLQKGAGLAAPVAGGKRGQEFTSGAVVSDQLSRPPRGPGDSSVGGRSPPLELPGLLRGGKGVQSPRPRWKPDGLSRSSWGHAEAPRDHGYLDVCTMDTHHLWGVRGGGQPLSSGGPLVSV